MAEQLMGNFIHIASCGQKEPIEWYVQEGGYQGQKCKLCGGQKPRNKVILFSPTLGTDFPYGSSYVCDACVPNVQVMVEIDRYYDLLYGPINEK